MCVTSGSFVGVGVSVVVRVTIDVEEGDTVVLTDGDNVAEGLKVKVALHEVVASDDELIDAVGVLLRDTEAESLVVGDRL